MQKKRKEKNPAKSVVVYPQENTRVLKKKKPDWLLKKIPAIKRNQRSP